MLLAGGDEPRLFSPAMIVTGIVALGVALIAGVPRRVNGPRRLSEKENSSDVLGIAGLGLMAWAAAMFFMNRWMPAKPTDAELLTFNGGTELAAFIFMLFGSATMRREGLRRMGLSLQALPRGIVLGILAIIVVLPLMFCVSAASESVWRSIHYEHPEAHDMLLMLTRDHQSVLMTVAIVASATIIAPLAEEMFFRGCIQTIIRYSTNWPWLAIIITSLLFALIHPLWTAPPIFFLSVCLGYLYERTANLWACMILHALFNSCSIYLYLHMH
jgi:membrane protease YdiL (CAAX protease family)